MHDLKVHVPAGGFIFLWFSHNLYRLGVICGNKPVIKML
ncbi:hypothetical protein CGSHiR3021_07712 [Haemophilus influenzae 22.4-21]|uniref:Uncharacterized protein n=1 Tax=Haemophilus influenzae 22.4-21 TaxID=375063 RepID=A4NX43_HAEIF|nr:hypothetical protein CGSHiR3021_07712 [Haemophilus influenzae 22.4-21]